MLHKYFICRFIRRGWISILFYLVLITLHKDRSKSTCTSHMPFKDKHLDLCESVEKHIILAKVFIGQKANIEILMCVSVVLFVL